MPDVRYHDLGFTRVSNQPVPPSPLPSQTCRGCIVRSGLAQILRRSLREILGHFEGNVQRSCCVNYFHVSVRGAEKEKSCDRHVASSTLSSYLLPNSDKVRHAIYPSVSITRKHRNSLDGETDPTIFHCIIRCHDVYREFFRSS